MADANVRRKNLVFITGYLKENTLKVISSPKSGEAIAGSIIVAIDDVNAHKVQFYAPKTFKSGKGNKLYDELAKILPTVTISMASYLMQNPSANFSIASQCSTKITVRAHFDEYASKLDNKERNIITLKGDSVNIKTVTDAQGFKPSAKFTVDMFIKSIANETKYEDGEPIETERLVITGLIPDYTNRVHQITFVTGTKEVSDFVSSNYHQNQTANFTGYLVNTTIREEAPKVDAGDSFGWGDFNTKGKTTFVHERVIMGREPNKIPLEPTDPGAITLEEVKNGLVLRDEQIIKNTTNRNNGSSSSSSTKPVSQSAPVAQPIATPTDAFTSLDLNDF